MNLSDDEDVLIETMMLEYNEELPDFGTLDKTGYTFIGWQLNGELIELTNMPANDINLKAFFEINEYKISYYQFDEDAPYLTAELNIDEEIRKLCLGGNNSSYLTTHNRIIGIGRNNGDGAIAYVSTPKDITDLFLLVEDEIIVDLKASSFSSIALTSKGRVFTWGDNEYGQLGNGTNVESIVPIDITSYFNLEENETITAISLGIYHGLVLTSNNRLFSWGRNNYSQLGNGTNVDSNVPVNINTMYNPSLNEGEVIVQITSGINHSGFRTNLNRVYSWGHNGFGQLGLNHTFDMNIPSLIAIQLDNVNGETITKIDYSGLSSGALLSSGRILFWGNNDSGHLVTNLTVPIKQPMDVTMVFDLEAGEKIVDFALGIGHTAFLTSNKRVLMVGSNFYGQLGTNDISGSTMTPTDITSNLGLKNGDFPKSISVGFYHTAILTNNGMLYVYGSNQYGQLGKWKPNNNHNPLLLPFKLLVSKTYEQTYDYNSLIDLYVVERLGYNFAGWLTNKELTKGFNMTNMPDYDIILYNRWNVIYYGITYNLDGGVNDYNNLNFYTIETADIILKEPTKEGYIFAGWYSNDAFAGEATEKISTGSLGEIELFAKWDDASSYLENRLVKVGLNNETYLVPTNEDDSAIVSVDGGYLMANSETTYELWYLVINWAINNDYLFESLGTEGYYGVTGAKPTTKNLPVVNVSFYDIIVWLNALSEMNGLNPVYRDVNNLVLKDSRNSNLGLLGGVIQGNFNGYRLPTSNEWEMAARWTNDLDSSNNSILVGSRYWTPGNYASGANEGTSEAAKEVAWFQDSVPEGESYIPREVLTKLPNQLNLFDMNGNVKEIVFDTGTRSNTRTARGGYAGSTISKIYVSEKQNITTNLGNWQTGFRIAINGQ